MKSKELGQYLICKSHKYILDTRVQSIKESTKLSQEWILMIQGIASLRMSHVIQTSSECVTCSSPINLTS